MSTAPRLVETEIPGGYEKKWVNDRGIEKRDSGASFLHRSATTYFTWYNRTAYEALYAASLETDARGKVVDAVVNLYRPHGVFTFRKICRRDRLLQIKADLGRVETVYNFETGGVALRLRGNVMATRSISPEICPHVRPADPVRVGFKYVSARLGARLDARECLADLYAAGDPPKRAAAVALLGPRGDRAVFYSYIG